MNKLAFYTLRTLRKIYIKVFSVKSLQQSYCEDDPNKAAQIIYNTLISAQPCMIARFGSTEMACLNNYMGVKYHKNKIVSYLKGKTEAWWWHQNIIDQMQHWSGFFPPQIDKIEQFCEMMLNDIPQVDILGSWLPSESLYDNLLGEHKKIGFELMNPYFSKSPWTLALKGKKVLVVHPFAKTIESQYKKRTLLFENDLLPQFELKTLKAVQSIAGEKTPFNDWFEALDWMKNEIDKTDYDICLIGAGAYGFPLAAHVKRKGKKAYHMGGSLQLLFGIRGKRWENENYGPKYNYAHLMNEHWVKPGTDEKPKDAFKVEGSCYW